MENCPECIKPTHKNCVQCSELIKENASICKHCGQPQKDKFSLSRFSLFLGVIISTASLATIGFQAFKQLQEPNNSNIVGNIFNFDKQNFNLILSNRGNKAAVVWDLSVTYPEAYSCEKDTVSFVKKVEIANTVLEANKTYSIPVNSAFLNISAFSSEAFTDKEIKEKLKEFEMCSAKITYLDFDNENKEKEIKFVCMPLGECR